MFDVIDGGKSILDRVAYEIKNNIAKRRQNGEIEWDTLDYLIQSCKDRGLKAGEAAAIVYINYEMIDVLSYNNYHFLRGSEKFASK